MKPFVTYASRTPALKADRAFFAANPHRQFRARDFAPEELGLPADVALFAKDERGEPGETNLVVVKRVRGGRVRRLFSVSFDKPLSTDNDIEAFLRSRGISPFHFDRELWRL